MCMAEIDTFDEMTGTIEGSITFGVKELTSKAISKKLITRKEQRKINSITPEHDQASFFVEVFAQKIEDDATVMERFIDMLREVPIYDKLVKKLGRHLSRPGIVPCSLPWDTRLGTPVL